MHEWTLAAVTAILLGYAACSGWLPRTPITPAIVFVTAGFIVGDHALGLIANGPGESDIRLAAEATLTLVLFADASRINTRTLRAEYLVPARLLGIGLPLTIVLGGLVAAVLFGALSTPEALIVAVLLAPTDAALGQAVVTDSRLPSRIRQGLNIESGLNDGLCVPILFILLAVAEADAGERSDAQALKLILEAIGYGVLGGVVAGVVAALILSRAKRPGGLSAAWTPAIPVVGAGLAYGLAAPLGGSGFIAAFVAGLTYGWFRHHSHASPEIELVDELGELLNGATFILFGAVLVGPMLDALDWQIVLYAVLSLTVIRMVPVAISLVGTRAKPPTVGFLGWFGPRGLASIVFAVIIIEEARLPGTNTVLAVTFATVVLSVFAHGLTAQAFTDRYAAWYHRHPDDGKPPMESVPTPEQPTRRRMVVGTGSTPPE